MKYLILYVHGKGGIAAECEHYRPLFPDCEVFGLDYQTFTPWETGAEIHAAVLYREFAIEVEEKADKSRLCAQTKGE